MNEPTLPELPPIDGYIDDEIDSIDAWDQHSMREYARAAVLAERERCARICEELIAFNEDDPGQAPANHIRLGAEPGEWIEDHLDRAASIREGV